MRKRTELHAALTVVQLVQFIEVSLMASVAYLVTDRFTYEISVLNAGAK
jgi:hypothetical protein